ncbi:MAG: glycosyltransferase [Deltaproteobacteria bacterium]|nr:glycosyltransferase [Deltaproteobacteria bacterium]
MNDTKKQYTSHDVAFIIPTKDRPEKLKNLLDSLAGQNEICGRLIVVDGGKSIKTVVMGFSDSLPVEYYECYPPGQIRQRNMAISLLDKRTPLVGLLDDDIVLETNALEKIVNFWNRCEPNTAGVSFNIVNAPLEQCSWLKSAFLLGSPEPGRVLKSGMTSSNCNVSKDVKVQWLCGGATIWRQKILKAFLHREISSRWAIAEDLIFSYPIGGEYPLYVCADARVRHEHEIDYVSKIKNRFHGYTQTIWMFYFVESNQELSRTLFLWTLLVRIIGKLATGILTLRTAPIEFAVGQVQGSVKGLSALIRSRDITTIFDEDTNNNPK